MQRYLRLQLIRAVTSSPPSTPPPLSSIELLTKEMIRIKKNKINNDMKTDLHSPLHRPLPPPLLSTPPPPLPPP